MSNTDSISAAGTEALLTRTSRFLLLFAGVLFCMLLLSRFFLLPRFTQVDIAGASYEARDLPVLRASLSDAVQQLEEQRDALLFPVQYPQYRHLVQRKHAQADAAVLYDRIDAVAGQFRQEGMDAVFFSSLRLDPALRVLTLEGDVRNVGMRSMTVLAQFLEALRSLPFVSSVDSPRFVRLQDDSIGSYSPFTIHLTIL